jgi:hypothetical protein
MLQDVGYNLYRELEWDYEWRQHQESKDGETETDINVARMHPSIRVLYCIGQERHVSLRSARVFRG